MHARYQWKRFLTLNGVALLFAVSTAVGQEAPAPPAPVKPSPEGINLDTPSAEEPPIGGRPISIPLSTPPDRPNLPVRPDRGNSPNLPPPSQTLRELIKDFQAARQSYIKQQKDLLQELKTASAEEREAIRNQIKENLETWMEEQKQRIKETVEQAKEIKEKIPALRDVVEGAKGEGRGR